MGRIAFESASQTVTIHNPLKGFALEEQRVEVRRDPLLGDTSVHNAGLGAKSGYIGRNDPELIRALVEESAAGCIFCGENVGSRTPRYPEALVPGGRLEAGEAVLFPNLFAIAAHHAVVSLCRAHFLELSGFTPALIADGLRALQRFLHAVHRTDASAAYATVNANYLLPAGASLVHPHLQMLVTPLAYSYQARLLEAARRYREEHGTVYFDDLAAEERRLGARYVARRGGWHWLAAYSPIGTNEVTAVHGSECDLAALPDADLEELAAGVSRVLALYGEMGHLPFNYTLYSARGGPGAAGARCVLKIVTRQNLSRNYRNDEYYLQKLLQSELILTLPEELASRLRPLF